MNISIFALVSVLTGVAMLQAAPLDKQQISPNAKWILHLDVDNFKATRTGKTVGRQILDKLWTNPKTELKNKFNVDVDWSQLQSVTLFGTEFDPGEKEDGVVLIKVDKPAFENIRSGMEKAVVQTALLGSLLTKTETEGLTVFQAKDLMTVHFSQNGLIILSKQAGLVKSANDVATGRSPSLSNSDTFSDLTPAPDSFFFIALAEGFSKKNIPLANAQILQQADGGRLALGERSDRLALSIVLRTRTVEICQQIYQTVNGMLALVSLSQSDKPEIMQLVQNTKISSKDKMVQMDVEYPVQNVIEKINNGQWKPNLDMHPGNVEKSEPGKSVKKSDK